MRILYIITDLATGGAEKQVAHLAERMLSRGHTVAIVAMVDDPLEKRVFIPGNVEIFSLRMRPGTPTPGAILHLIRIVRSFRPDIVHSHMIHANILARVARLFIRMKVLVCTAHSDIETRSIFLLGMYRITDGLCDIMTNVSDAAVAQFVRQGISPAGKIQRVYDGVDISVYASSVPDDRSSRKKLANDLGVRESDTLVVYAGRMEYVKGCDILAEAILRIHNEGGRGIAFAILGDGSQLPAIKSLLRGVPSVKFYGMVADVRPYLGAADIFVMPSRNEGFGISLVEAIASGLYPIVTECAGSVEILNTVGTGSIVKREDSGALAQAIMKASGKKDIQKISDHQISLLYENFHLDRIADTWESIYRQRLPG